MKQFTKSFAYTTEQGAVLIDTGLYSGRGMIESKTGAVTAVLATHGHWDHTGGHAYFQNKGAKVYLQKRDEPIARDLRHQWELLYEQFADDFDIPAQRRVIYDDEAGTAFQADHALTDGESLSFGALTFDVLETPGHSSGSVCYFEKGTGAMFTGDTLCGAGFFDSAPQISDVDEYRQTLHRLGALDVDAVYGAHLEKALSNKEYHEMVRLGARVCERYMQDAEAYLKRTGNTLTLKSMMSYLCQAEGGRSINSGIAVTAVSLLKYFSGTYPCAADCLRPYRYE